tara:strand:- start:675 stop:1064 length:390 start_codon:yes stop_codon:yes gene_type:complete
MKNQTTQTVAEQIETKLIDLFDKNNLDIDIICHLNNKNIDDIDDFDDLHNLLDDDNALDIEIIYYNKAIDFLSENDASLCDSFALASELGYTIENINSELLASILATDILRVQFYELETEINEIFELKN